jgi:hypothetical protein
MILEQLAQFRESQVVRMHWRTLKSENVKFTLFRMQRIDFELTGILWGCWDSRASG